MISFDKWKLPDGESHLQDWMVKKNQRVDGRLTYQYHKYERALAFCKDRRLALDVGAHVGLWGWFMARDFEDVAGFEPMKAHQACWYENMKDRPNAELYEVAVGAEAGSVAMHTTPHSSGGTYVIGGSDIEQITIDSLNFHGVDFIKVDCEGYELNVLQGARETILKHKPVIVVEQKGDMIAKYGHKPLAAVKWLEDLGYDIAEVISGDYIMRWA